MFAGLPERYQPTNLPRCAACGAQINGSHTCSSICATTSVPVVGVPGSIRVTPWGTWEWKPW